MLAQMTNTSNRTMTTITVPTQYAAMSPAWKSGYMDASDGYPFAPEQYFVKRHQRAAYTLGFLERQPGNMAAERWWQRFEIAIDMEAAEALDMAAEQESIRHGMF